MDNGAYGERFAMSVGSQNNYLTQGEMDLSTVFLNLKEHGLKITISRKVRWIFRGIIFKYHCKSQNNYLTQGEMDQIKEHILKEKSLSLKITISRKVRWIKHNISQFEGAWVSQNNYLTQGEMD